MLCFRCGSPLDAGVEQCPNCGQDLQAGQAPDTEAFADLQKQLRRGDRAEAQTSTFHIGDVVLDRYEITDVLGRGPLGVVYKALDQEVEVDVALKVIDADLMTDAGEREAFLETVGALRQVVHNNVVRYFDVDHDGDRCFYVTQFLEGLTLRKIIDLRREKGQRFSLTEVEPICSQLCDALSTGEAVHGGLKPDNAIILPDLLKVTDFRLAEALPRDAYLTAQREAGGAFAYLAPEVRDGGAFDERADVYSIAVILCELLTGTVFDGGKLVNLQAIDPTIPVALSKLLEQALAQRPAMRPANAQALGDGLAAVVGGEDLLRSTARYGSPDDESPKADELDEAEADGEGSAKATRPMGSSSTPVAAESLLDSKGRPRTLGYGEAFNGAAVRAEAERRVASRKPAKSEKAKREKEVTQQLSMDDVEAIDEEGAEAELAAAAQASQAVVSRARESTPVIDAPEVTPKTEPPPEKTQALSIDEVEMIEGSPDSPVGSGDDYDVTVPRMTMEEAMGPRPGDDLEDSLFLAGREGGSKNSSPTLELPAASRGAAPASDKTQQIDPEMIVEGEDDDDVEQEQLVLVPPEELRDRVSVSGETESTVWPLPNAQSDEPVLPHERRGSSTSEARARDVLSAFDAGEESGARAMPAAPAGDKALDELPEPPPPAEQEPLPPVVAPAVLNADAVPLPLDETQAVVKPLPLPRQVRRSRSRAPVILAVIIGLLAGASAAIIYSLMQNKRDKANELARKRSQVGSASPQRPVAKASMGPAVVPLKPQVHAADAGVPDSAAKLASAPDAAPKDKTDEPDKDETNKTGKTGKTDKVAKRDQPVPTKRAKVAKASKARKQPKKTRVAKVTKNPKAKLTSGKDSKKNPATDLKTDPAKDPKTNPAQVASSNKCYRGMVHIKRKGSEGYCIDRYEAPGRGRVPRRGISLASARAKCRARGLRLCSAREWMRACAGLFPYGRKYDATRCNTGSKKVLPAGSKRRCRSRWGVYDLSGNVSEWVESGQAMGGHYAAAQGHASCVARGSGGANTGYRCCGDPSWE